MAFCDFGKEVKKKLVDIDQTQSWLIEQVKADTGLFLDSSYLNKILTGERTPKRIIDSISRILEIEQDIKKPKCQAKIITQH